MTALLPVKDYQLLRQWLATLNGSGGAFEVALRHKLDNARLLSPGEPSGDLVRLGSRVRFRIASNTPEERTLVFGEDYAPDGRCLSVDSPIGLALLGLKAGVSTEVEWRPSHKDVITILSVSGSASSPAPPGGAVIIPFRPKTAIACPVDDGPGPSAA